MYSPVTPAGGCCPDATFFVLRKFVSFLTFCGSWTAYAHLVEAQWAEVQVQMGEREAVLSRLRARLERMGDLVATTTMDGQPDARSPLLPSGERSAVSGLEAVLRAPERGTIRSTPRRPSQRASA